jgi:hypothetical protein
MAAREPCVQTFTAAPHDVMSGDMMSKLYEGRWPLDGSAGRAMAAPDPEVL